jgi:hypothetical protein
VNLSAGSSAGGGTLGAGGDADGAGEARARREASGRVVWSATISQDGVIAGPDDAMSWESPARDE